MVRSSQLGAPLPIFSASFSQSSLENFGRGAGAASAAGQRAEARRRASPIAVSSTRARAFASPSSFSLRARAPSLPRSSSVVTLAFTSTPWITTLLSTSVVSFFFAYSCIFAMTSGAVEEVDVGRPVGRPLRDQLALDLRRAGERGRVGGRLGAGAQHRGPADLEHHHATASSARRTTSRPGEDLSVFAPKHHRPRYSRARPFANGPAGPTAARDRGSTFVWASLGPAVCGVIWAAMNPRQRRGILLLTLSALGLLGVFVLVAGYVADVRAEVDPKVRVLALDKPAEKDKAITDDMVKTIELPRRWAPKTALRDRARLIGQVATADAPAESILQEGMLGPPPELATGEREIAILVDAETGVAGKIDPGAIGRHRRHLRRQRPDGRQGGVADRRARRADHRRRPARAEGRQPPPGAGRRPAAGRPGHLRAGPEGGPDRHLRGVVRLRGPPRAAAPRRGVQAQEEAADVPAAAAQ